MIAMAGQPERVEDVREGQASASLADYKTQYAQLAAELADFQASSRELEAELEKDVEAAEQRERRLAQKVESLGYQVDEWRVRFVGRLSPHVRGSAFYAC